MANEMTANHAKSNGCENKSKKMCFQPVCSTIINKQIELNESTN